MVVGRSADSGVNATMGVISAVSGPWRTWRGARMDRYIRLDMTLYPALPEALSSIRRDRRSESQPAGFPASRGFRCRCPP